MGVGYHLPEAAVTRPTPVLSADILRRIDELHANTPYDGRRVVLREKRGGWRWWGLRGVCIRLANDRRSMVLKVEHCPDDYWPIGMEVLAELDHETVPYFTENQ